MNDVCYNECVNLENLSSKNDILTVEEMASHLHISRNTAYKLVKEDGFFPAFRIGRKILISVNSLNRWIKEKSL